MEASPVTSALPHLTAELTHTKGHVAGMLAGVLCGHSLTSGAGASWAPTGTRSVANALRLTSKTLASQLRRVHLLSMLLLLPPKVTEHVAGRQADEEAQHLRRLHRRSRAPDQGLQPSSSDDPLHVFQSTPSVCGEGRAQCAARQLPPAQGTQQPHSSTHRRASISTAAPETWRRCSSALHSLLSLVIHFTADCAES